MFKWGYPGNLPPRAHSNKHSDLSHRFLGLIIRVLHTKLQAVVPSTAGPFCAIAGYLWSAINRGTEWACTQCRNHIQGLTEEHTASVLSKDPSDKAAPSHQLFVQPDPSHMCTKVWPGMCLRPWSSCYLTLLPEKQKQHWSGAHTPYPTSKRPQNPATNKQNMPRHAIHTLKELKAVSEI